MPFTGRLSALIPGNLDRKGYWIGFAIHLALSIAIVSVWTGLAEAWPDDRPLLVIVPVRLLSVGPQLSIHVRRLHDAGHSGKWVLCLLALYAMGLAAFIQCQHRLDGWGEELALLRWHASDESTGNVQALYDYELQNALMAGAGVLAGMPGPLQLIFAGIVGSLKPTTPRP